MDFLLEQISFSIDSKVLWLVVIQQRAIMCCKRKIMVK